MAFESLRALVFDLNRDVHGVAATVTRPQPNDEPIETRVIWIAPETIDLPGGSEFQRREAIHVMALGRDVLETVPRGTIVLAPERPGGEVLRWRVDGLERADADHHRVYLIPDPEPES
jgi:hypothetical protein